jgi:tetratricopeptide (TPR) repeat protein
LRALEIHREIGARRDEATCLMRLAALFGNRRDVHRARDVLLEAHALHRELGNTAQEAQSLRLLALATHELGELDVAVQLIEESLAMLQRTGDRSGEIAVLRMFAMLLLEIDRDDEALASARSALALCKRFDSPRIAIDVLISLACVHLCAARDDAADDVLSQAAELAVSISDDEGEGEALAFRAVVFAARGEIDAAKEAFRAARARLDGRMDRSHLPTVEVLEGALDDDGGLARIAKLRQRGPSDSSTVRVAMRLLEARRARKKAAPTAPAPNTPFEIEASGRWFRAPGATRVSLARRPSLARLLAALLRNSLETPGEGAPWETLFAEGWPGERVQRQAGKNRVQVAIRTLRREGLEPVLLTVEGAYLLDAARAKQAG